MRASRTTTKPNGGIMEQVTEPTFSPIMHEEPSVIASFEKGWKLLWGNFGIILLVWIVSTLISVSVSLVSGFLPDSGSTGTAIFWGIVLFIFNFFIAYPVQIGVIYFMIKIARGDNAELKDIFEAFNHYGSALLMMILLGLIIGIGFLLLIIPGIILGLRLYYTPFILIDQKLGAVDAIKASWEMTRGHGGQVFLMFLLGIPIMIGGMIALIIGIIPASLWMSLAFAVFYTQLNPRAPVPVEEYPPITA